MIPPYDDAQAHITDPGVRDRNERRHNALTRDAVASRAAAYVYGNIFVLEPWSRSTPPI